MATFWHTVSSGASLCCAVFPKKIVYKKYFFWIRPIIETAIWKPLPMMLLAETVQK